MPPLCLNKLTCLFLLGTHVAGWTDWSWWKPCSKSCGGGVRSRKRKCTNPPPSPGGLNCTGNFSQIESCNVHFCPGKMMNFFHHINGQFA